MRYSILLPIFLCFPYTAKSVDLLVPQDLPTIQAAIDAATAGDRILVDPGTYMEHIDFKGKAVVLKSVAGAKSTVIDGTKTGRVVTFQSGEKKASVLEGFTITNGEVQTSNGGGIDCTLESSPTITDCIISYNKADALGGGIACRGFSNPLIRRCRFIGNICRDYYQGSNGGGLCCFLSSPEVIDCEFIANETQYGGGIDIQGGRPLIINCTFIGNVADKGGGAIDCSVGDAIITNCTMVKNSAYFGGGLSITGAYLPSYPVLTNCIMWQNTPNEIQALIGHATVTYSDVQGGWTGAGNIDAHPQFVNIELPTEDSDLHLTYYSPCRDAGLNSTPEISGGDFEGDPRIAGQGVDMGADEFHAHLYVTGEATPGGNIQAKLAGIPGTSPVGLIVGAGILETPSPTAWGDFWLESPWLLIPLLLEPYGMPGNGILTLPVSIPIDPPAPYNLPMQALIGLDQDSLTNLEVLEVR
jgi:predicted outer membrane repeat protein